MPTRPGGQWRCYLLGALAFTARMAERAPVAHEGRRREAARFCAVAMLASTPWLAASCVERPGPGPATTPVEITVGQPTAALPPAAPSVAATPENSGPTDGATAPAHRRHGLPWRADAKLARHVSCGRADCVPARELGEQAATVHPLSPAALFSADLAPAAVLRVPNHAGIDACLVTLSGEVVLRDAARPRDDFVERLVLGRGQGICAPGGGIDVATDSPARLVVAIVTDGGPLGPRLGSPAPWVRRLGPVAALDLGEQKELRWAGGAMRARIGAEQGRTSLGLLVVGADPRMPMHAHDRSWEIIGVLEGSGRTALAQPPPSLFVREEAVVAGSVIAVPPGVRHRASSDARGMVALQMFAPPGPEQRYRALAAPTR